MRFTNDTPNYAQFPIILPRPAGQPIRLTGLQPRYGWYRHMRDLLPLPIAPLGEKLRHPKTDREIRDETGQPIRGQNFDDPEYIKARSDMVDLRMAVMMWEMIRHNKDVEFANDTPLTEEWTVENAVGYAQAIFDDMCESLTPTDIGRLTLYASDGGIIEGEEIEDAKRPFSPDTQTSTHSNTKSGEPSSDSESRPTKSGE